MSEEMANANVNHNAMENANSIPYVECSPDCDIEEAKDEFIVTMDMPGLNSKAIKVELDRDMLNVSAVAEIDGLEARLYKRQFRVMRGLDATKVQADYKLGILTLRLPKPVAQQAKKIQIQCE